MLLGIWELTLRNGVGPKAEGKWGVHQDQSSPLKTVVTAVSLLQSWHETGELDLEERREREGLTLACLFMGPTCRSRAMPAVVRGWVNWGKLRGTLAEKICMIPWR